MNLLSRPGLQDEGATSAEVWTLQDLSYIPEPEPAPSSDALAAEIEEQEILARKMAEEDLEQRLKSAYEAGYEEGRLEGEIAEGVRLRNAVQAAETALDEIRENEGRWQSAIRPNLAALAIAIARHVIGRELNTDAEAIADCVRRALAEFPLDQALRIRINPHDLSLISAGDPIQGGPPSIAPNRDLRWLADPRIEPGGCLVEGREQIIDGRVDTALERLYRRMAYNHA